MSFAEVLVLILIAMLGVQQAFWTYKVQGLLALMKPEAYAQYVQTKMFEKIKPQPSQEKKKTDDEVDEYSVAQARKANELFGMN